MSTANNKKKTMSSNIERTRLWVATIFDMEFDFETLFVWGRPPTCRRGAMTYLGWGRETCPTTGREHFQVCVRFKNPRGSLPGVSKLFTAGRGRGPGKAHVERMVGTLEQSIAYCSKDGDYESLGCVTNQGERKDLDQIMEEIKTKGLSELDIAEQNPQRWCQYGRRFERYRKLLEARRTKKTEVRVWWGPPGTGKTHAAVNWLDDMYDDVSYTRGGFFIGYHNHPNILLDDFDAVMMERSIFMKMTDEYKYTANIKGGEINWNPKKIAITSNTDPAEWYTNVRSGDEYAVSRRIDKITNLTERIK